MYDPSADAGLTDELRETAELTAPFDGIVRCVATRPGGPVSGMAFRHPSIDPIQTSVFVADDARALFAAGTEAGYLFDVELLALAERAGLAVAEVPVNWSERPGSKVRFVRDSLRMFAGLWGLRRRLKALPAVVVAPARKAA